MRKSWQRYIISLAESARCRHLNVLLQRDPKRRPICLYNMAFDTAQSTLSRIKIRFLTLTHIWRAAILAVIILIFASYFSLIHAQRLFPEQDFVTIEEGKSVTEIAYDL